MEGSGSALTMVCLFMTFSVLTIGVSSVDFEIYILVIYLAFSTPMKPSLNSFLFPHRVCNLIARNASKGEGISDARAVNALASMEPASHLTGSVQSRDGFLILI